MRARPSRSVVHTLAVAFLLLQSVVPMPLGIFVPTALAASTLLSDGFGTGGTDSTFDESPAWTEGGDGATKQETGGGNNSASLDGNRFALLSGTAGHICISVDATGYENVQLSYYWRGDQQAGDSSDDGIVEMKSASGNSCSDGSGWTQLQNHDMGDDSAWTTQSAFANAGFDDTSFLLRFRTATTASNEDFRVDGVLVTGDEIVGDGTLTVVKEAHGGDASFDFEGEGEGAGEDFESFSIDTGEDADVSFSLPPGTYSVDEVNVPADWMLVSNGCVSVTVDPGEETVCTVVNKKKATIEVVKQTVNGFGTFHFTGESGEDELGGEDGFDITTQDGAGENPDDNPVSSFFDVFVDIEGTNVDIAEQLSEGDGWDLTSLSCTVDGEGAGEGENGAINFELAPGEAAICTFVNEAAICGNNDIEDGEMCDDGETDGGDGCSPTCQLESCGNGTTDSGEECDDGENASGDGCSYQCENEFCGDGKVNNNGEECDDGNTNDADGCSASCVVEEGFDCSESGETDGGGMAGPSSCSPICGDGQVNGEEECDDGESDGGDGCSAMCEEEPTYQCDDSEPSICAQVLDFGDAPDDGEGEDPGYPTLLESNGARHGVTEGIQLGEVIDADSDGQPTAGADGDDTETDDEDGVSFSSFVACAEEASVSVTGLGTGYLDGWFDWNNDLDWDDEDEHVIDAGPLTLTLDPATAFSVGVPCGAAGNVYSRFRFSTVDQETTVGEAADGEVEDDVVNVSEQSSSSSSSSEGSSSSDDGEGSSESEGSSSSEDGSSSSSDSGGGGLSLPEPDGNTDGASRGDGTHILRGVTHFLVGHHFGGGNGAGHIGGIPPGGFGGIAPGAFGGVPGGPLTDAEEAFICALQDALPRVPVPGLADWLIEYVALLLGANPDVIEEALRDPSLCEKSTPLSRGPVDRPFAVTFDGYPVSSTSALFNRCIRGDRLTVADIRVKPYTRREDVPLTCSDFTHAKGWWYHPDLHVHFQWDRLTKKLGVPEGFALYRLPTTVVQK